MVVLLDPEWIQEALNVPIFLFRWYILLEKVDKSKAMMCQQGTIWSGMLKEAVGQQCTDRGETYKERLRPRIPYTYCIMDIK